jgi:hypothetical protein
MLLLSFVCWFLPTSDGIEKVLNDIFQKANSTRLKSILPKTYGDFQRVARSARSFDQQDLATAVAEEISVLPRSVSWIRENGMCLDNIIPANSTIPQAGRGAFAQRALRKGQMIVPVPLLHVTNRKAFSTRIMMMVKKDDGESGGDKTTTTTTTTTRKVKGMQLLVNYCFGHDESSLLLCPVTNSILINHCSVRKKECGPEGPNAIYQWASGGWDPNTEASLKKTTVELAEASAFFFCFCSPPPLCRLSFMVSQKLVSSLVSTAFFPWRLWHSVTLPKEKR